MADTCYIVAFQTTADTAQLVAAIKSYLTWARITDSTWAIVSDKSVIEIRDHLKSLIGTDGRLFVVKSGVGAAWKNTICTSEWLQKNL